MKTQTLTREQAAEKLTPTEAQVILAAAINRARPGNVPGVDNFARAAAALQYDVLEVLYGKT